MLNEAICSAGGHQTRTNCNDPTLCARKVIFHQMSREECARTAGHRRVSNTVANARTGVRAGPQRSRESEALAACLGRPTNNSEKSYDPTLRATSKGNLMRFILAASAALALSTARITPLMQRCQAIKAVWKQTAPGLCQRPDQRAHSGRGN
jgi:hypothetical protein